MGRCCGSQGQGGDLVAAAAALSVLMARGKTAEQISLLALRAPSAEDCRCQEDTPQENE